jgi:hypothetical protein
MPKGKPSTEEEEKKPRESIKSGADYDVMGHELSRTNGAILENSSVLA